MVKRVRKDEKNPLWVSEPNQVVGIQMTESGFGAVEPKTIIHVLLKTLEEHGDKRAMCQKRTVKARIYITRFFSFPYNPISIGS